jgi:phospholipid/cholesterol/gamma-HCH transport system substrate-binding protein
MSVNGDVDLPANTTATVGQTSLLGSLHIELAAPTDAPAEGKLHGGSLIPLRSGGSYPTTEQTLAVASALLNGGGLGQLQDITKELSVALGGGRDQELRHLLTSLDEFIGHLDAQKSDIIAATDSLNTLTGKFADQKPVVDHALDTIPNALAVLKDQRDNLAVALDEFGKLSALAASAVGQTKENLIKELHQIAPVLRSLADAGPALTRALSLATYPFPVDTLNNFIRGDYVNLTAVIDMTLSRLDSGIFTGTRFEGDLTELELQWGRTIGQLPSPYTRANPLVAPYHLDQGP